MLVADLPFFFEDAKGGPHRRIARRIRKLLVDFRGGGTPVAIQDVHDLPLSIAQSKISLLLHAPLHSRAC